MNSFSNLEKLKLHDVPCQCSLLHASLVVSATRAWFLGLCYGNSGIHIFCRKIFRHIQGTNITNISFRPPG
ncbi:hypothetical protein ACN38_g2101 [Penicillium nordicum]|uniref:Uncharacterized protein n=1 Tax=Penicillium nordicum TaxID=229535 RepID=A0A0M8PFZ7_9EURO|nr:hypothetical protein ACN38_g2101 [Penicillium nordicum]